MKDFNNSFFLRYLLLYREYKFKLFLGIFFAIIQSLSLTPLPLIFKQVIDKFIPNQQVKFLIYSGIAVISLYALNLTFAVISRYFTLYVTKQVILKIRADLCNKLQQISIRYYDNTHSGKLHTKVIQDTERVDVMSNALVANILVSIFTGIASIVILAKINVTLTLCLVALLPILFVSQRLLKKQMVKNYRNWRGHFEDFSSMVQEVLSAIKLIRVFTAEEYENKRLHNKISNLSGAGVEMATFSVFFSSLMELIVGLGTVLVIILGGILTIKNVITLGEMVAFYSAIGLLFNPLHRILNSFDQIYAGFVSLENIYEIIDLDEIEPQKGKKGLKIPEGLQNVTGNVEFRNVYFAYNNKEVLHNISISNNPGKCIALVGKSGAGKTTFVNLLLGFYTPDKGEIFIDGNPIRSMDLKTLRSHIGVVTQDNILLSGTIKSNILYGNLKATDEQVIEAAKKANAHEFIIKTPNSYDSEVGERGVKLSGGQKQRVAIARTFLKDPKIIILDEATSSLDYESERKIQQAMEQLKINRTTFIIAHRLSTIFNADKIIVFKDGEIIEHGTHQELLDRKGEYFNLYGQQISISGESIQILSGSF